MNLKDFLDKKEKPPELLWSIVIEEGWVQAGIWYIGEKEAEVISISSPTAWTEDDELVGAVDTTLSSSVQKLPEEYKEPNKTVFGVSSSWVKNGEISEDYLGKIKKVCTELSLTPVGFVVLPEAIAHLYKSEESAPVSAIIVGLGIEFLELSVFKLGNLVGTTQVSRSVSVVEDIVEGLSRFDGAAPLPSRFILFDGKEVQLEEAKEALMQTEWNDNEKTKFLHTPKVEILSSDRKVIAVSLAGANEIGNITQVATKEIVEDEIPSQEEVVNVMPAEREAEKTAEDLGFVIGEDISVKEPAVHQFTSSPTQQIQTPAYQQPTVLPQVNSGPNYFQKTKTIFHNFSTTFFQNKHFSSRPNIALPGNKQSLYVALSVIVLLALSLVGLWWFYPKAVVAIYVTPKTDSQQVQIAFNTGGQFDATAGIIPAQVLTAKISGSKTKATSGTKTIGDRAKGTIKIGNSTPNDITLSAGTLIASADNLRFTLDNSASVSAGLDSFTPGTATVNVTAADIGAQYNLASGETFKVGTHPKAEVSAQSTVNFSGGSSTQISAVSKDDQATLETSLKTELGQNAIDQITPQLTNNQLFVNNLASLDATSETFDHKVGDQADSLKLNLNLTASGVAADKVKLLEYARGVLQSKIPTGYVLRDSQITFIFTYLDQKNGNYDYTVTLNANFLPQINTDNIVQQIVGKTPSVVEDYLSTIPGFSRADITLKPRLPGFLGTLPRIGKNITIQVGAE